jgi:hypothetical protein
MDVMVGGIQAPGGGSRGGEKCRLECCVSDKIFTSTSAYQLHITTYKVSLLNTDLVIKISSMLIPPNNHHFYYLR